MDIKGVELKILQMDNLSFIFKTYTESNLIFELELMHFVHQQMPQNWEQLINESIEYVIKEQPNLNDFNEEKIGEIFQETSYNTQRLLLELIYFRVGKRLATDTSRLTLEQLDEWGDSVMRQGFYRGYTLSETDINRLIDEIYQNPKYILHNVYDINCRAPQFAKYCIEEFKEDLSENQIIDKINLYNDGAYTILPDAVTTLHMYILKNNVYESWIHLYELLQYVPIQGALISHLNTVEECLAIIEAEEKNHVRFPKVFAYLMRERVFELFKKEQDLLERNSKIETLNDEDRKIGERLLEDWDGKKNEYIKCIVASWLQVFDLIELEEWLSKKYNHAVAKNENFKNIDLELLRKIESFLMPEIRSIRVDYDNMSLQTLLYHVSHMEVPSKEECEQGIRQICDKIYTEEHAFISWRLDEDSFKEIRAVAEWLKKSEKDGIDLMKKYIQYNEGYNSSIEKHIRIQQGNKWWLSILMFQTEDNLKEYTRYEPMLFECIRTCDLDHMLDYYLLPCCITELIVTQCLVDKKDSFEYNLITNISNLIFVITILIANEGNLSDENKTILTERIKQEWNIHKQLYSYNPNIQICDQYIQTYIKQ